MINFELFLPDGKKNVPCQVLRRSSEQTHIGVIPESGMCCYVVGFQRLRWTGG